MERGNFKLVALRLYCWKLKLLYLSTGLEQHTVGRTATESDAELAYFLGLMEIHM